MKKITPALLFFIVFPVMAWCQTVEKAANEAFLITRMVNKFHVAPRDVNDAFSRDVFKNMLEKTDPGRLFFTQGDITRLSVYKSSLDNEIKHRQAGYLKLFIAIYQQRLKQADSLVTEICKKPFDFTLPERFTAIEDTLYPQSLAGIRVKLYKKLKAESIYNLTDELPDDFKTFTPVKREKYTDSAAIVASQKKAQSSLKRKINTVLQNANGITRYVGNIYCETIAECFDPHTEFFPPDEKENFESMLGKQPFKFGFRIEEDKGGGVRIENLEPGSPAFKGGLLNKGDKFLSVQWEGSQPVDVTDVSLDDFGRLLDESNHKKVVFTVKKANGSITQVPLEKEKVAAGEGDDDRVKSFILKGANTIGYIYLPAFYEDWEANNDGLNGCANDVGREILKLKKENISGLILDLRYNGGGSVEEATELVGIFIDAGPVAQIKDREPKVYTMKDINRGTLYDGPLVILVNGYSASASELVAGTLQDYNRAVIIGSPTYGKATAQIVLPLDTLVTKETADQREADDYLKVTVSKLYRVNGTSAQFTGVQPDIVLPDMLDAYITKEADEPLALRPSAINPNKYYQPYAALPVKQLAAAVQREIDTSKFFNEVKGFIALSKQKKAAKDVTLNLTEAITAMDATPRMEDSNIIANKNTKKFTIQNNQYEMARLQTDSNLKELNETFSTQLATDPYLSIAYDVLSKLKIP